MAERQLPSIDLLRQLLRYEPETGKMFWKERPVETFSPGIYSAEHICAIWNRRLAGKQAFTANMDGYRYSNIGGVTIRAHRAIWAIVHGEWPAHQIDHINGNRSDNRIINLRPANNGENSRNSTLSRNNTSGRKGVYYCKKTNKWRARIEANGVKHNLGRFKRLEDAAFAYDAAARELHRDFAKTNEDIIGNNHAELESKHSA